MKNGSQFVKYARVFCEVTVYEAEESGNAMSFLESSQEYNYAFVSQ